MWNLPHPRHLNAPPSWSLTTTGCDFNPNSDRVRKRTPDRDEHRNPKNSKRQNEERLTLQSNARKGDDQLYSRADAEERRAPLPAQKEPKLKHSPKRTQSNESSSSWSNSGVKKERTQRRHCPHEMRIRSHPRNLNAPPSWNLTTNGCEINRNRDRVRKLTPDKDEHRNPKHSKRQNEDRVTLQSNARKGEDYLYSRANAEERRAALSKKNPNSNIAQKELKITSQSQT